MKRSRWRPGGGKQAGLLRQDPFGLAACCRVCAGEEAKDLKDLRRKSRIPGPVQLCRMGLKAVRYIAGARRACRAQAKKPMTVL